MQNFRVVNMPYKAVLVSISIIRPEADRLRTENFKTYVGQEPIDDEIKQLFPIWSSLSIY